MLTSPSASKPTAASPPAAGPPSGAPPSSPPAASSTNSGIGISSRTPPSSAASSAAPTAKPPISSGTTSAATSSSDHRSPRKFRHPAKCSPAGTLPTWLRQLEHNFRAWDPPPRRPYRPRLRHHLKIFTFTALANQRGTRSPSPAPCREIRGFPGGEIPPAREVPRDPLARDIC